MLRERQTGARVMQQGGSREAPYPRVLCGDNAANQNTMRNGLILGGVVVGVIPIAVYFLSQPPPRVEVNGAEETVAWVSLATAVVSFLTSLVGLVEKFVERRRRGEPG